MDNSISTISDKVIVTKTCLTCQRELPIDAFSKRRCRSSKPDAHWIYSRYSECKDCASKRKAHWRFLHPNYMKEWYTKHKHNK
jgi:ribosomal protein L40E